MDQQNKKPLWLWIGLFVFVFLLTQSHHLIHYHVEPSFLFGLPQWLGWFIGFHMLLILALYKLSKQSK